MKKTILSLVVCALVLCVASVKADEIEYVTKTYTTEATRFDLVDSAFSITIPEWTNLPGDAILKNILITVDVAFSTRLTVTIFDDPELPTPPPFVPDAGGYVSDVSWQIFFGNEPPYKHTESGDFGILNVYGDDKWASNWITASYAYEDVDVTVGQTLEGYIFDPGFSNVLPLIPNDYNTGLQSQFVGTYTISYIYDEPATGTPEPATLAIMGLGLAGAGFAARRRNKK